MLSTPSTFDSNHRSTSSQRIFRKFTRSRKYPSDKRPDFIALNNVFWLHSSRKYARSYTFDEIAREKQEKREKTKRSPKRKGGDSTLLKEYLSNLPLPMSSETTQQLPVHVLRARLQTLLKNETITPQDLFTTSFLIAMVGPEIPQDLPERLRPAHVVCKRVLYAIDAQLTSVQFQRVFPDRILLVRREVIKRKTSASTPWFKTVVPQDVLRLEYQFHGAGPVIPGLHERPTLTHYLLFERILNDVTQKNHLDSSMVADLLSWTLVDPHLPSKASISQVLEELDIPSPAQKRHEADFGGSPFPETRRLVGNESYQFHESLEHAAPKPTNPEPPPLSEATTTTSPLLQRRSSAEWKKPPKGHGYLTEQLRAAMKSSEQQSWVTIPDVLPDSGNGTELSHFPFPQGAESKTMDSDTKQIVRFANASGLYGFSAGVQGSAGTNYGLSADLALLHSGVKLLCDKQWEAGELHFDRCILQDGATPSETYDGSSDSCWETDEDYEEESESLIQTVRQTHLKQLC